MSIRTTLNVSLTLELRQHIEQQIKSGRYRTASELMRTALRKLQGIDEQCVKRNVAQKISAKPS